MRQISAIIGVTIEGGGQHYPEKKGFILYYNFLVNVIVVLFLCGVVIVTDLSIGRKYAQYIIGCMFGFITIFAMTGKIMVGEGRFF